MVVFIPEDIENALVEAARAQGISPERFVRDALRAKLSATTPPVVHGEWEALLFSVGSPAGVSLSDESTDREKLYN